MKNKLFTHPVLQLTSIQFKEFFREPGALFWTFIFPILMAWGLGVAFTQKDVLVQKIAVVSEKDQSPGIIGDYILDHGGEKLASEKEKMIIRNFNTDAGEIKFRFIFVDSLKAVEMIKKGIVNLYLSARHGQIIYHLDPLNNEAQMMQMRLDRFFQSAKIQADPGSIEVMNRIGSRYIDFLIPGLIALGIMNSCLWGISYSLIDKRAKKLLRRMVATPMKKWHFLIAQLLTRISLTLLESSALLIFAILFFKVEIQGSLPALITVVLAGNAAFIGIAILVSSRTANTHIGGGLINFVTMPMMVLSGIFFSYHNFPDWTIPYIKLLPLTEFADSIRIIFNEGAGFGDILLPVVIMFSSGFLTYFIGLKIYKWY